MERHRALFFLIVVLIFSPKPCDGAINRQSTYYVSNYGSDDNPGTRDLPWQTLDKISNFDFVPGDTVFFARGSRFTGGFIIKSSGRPGKPITFTSYGHGALPVFINPRYSNLNGNAIRVSGSYIVIDGLYFHNCPKSPVCVELGVVNDVGCGFLSGGTQGSVGNSQA